MMPESEGTEAETEPPNASKDGYPIPPPDAFAHPKQPELFLSPSSPSHSSAHTPSATSSPTASDTESYSLPSTRPPSAAPSRHPSVSGEKPSVSRLFSRATVPASSQNQVSSKPPSVHSESSPHKFNLKDLLASAGPKLTRRPSASSRKSDTSNDHKSAAGDSTTSFSQKYGVCGKIAVGKGATSVVRLAHKWDRTQSNEKLYAVKEFRKRRKNETEREYMRKLTSEFCISSTLHHVNVVETVDLIQDEAGHWCEVMEFCPGGDLYAAIKKGGMSESEVDCCFKQMLRGVAYLHGQGVAHRDLKPENMFFDSSGHLKIGDFGASTVYRLPWESSTHMSTGLCGSEPYIAPEQFLNKPYDARFVDIWACGIVYYCLYFQELPWRAAQMSEALYASYANSCSAKESSTGKNSTMTKEVNSTKSTPKDTTEYPTTITNLPRSSRHLLRRILEPSPKKRVGIEDILKDEWIEGVNVCVEDTAKAKHVHASARAVSAAVGV